MYTINDFDPRDALVLPAHALRRGDVIALPRTGNPAVVHHLSGNAPVRRGPYHNVGLDYDDDPFAYRVDNVDQVLSSCLPYDASVTVLARGVLG